MKRFMHEKVCKCDICRLFLSSENALQKEILGLYFALQMTGRHFYPGRKCGARQQADPV